MRRFRKKEFYALIAALVAIPLIVLFLSVLTRKDIKSPQKALSLVKEITKNPIETIAEQELLGEGEYAVVVKNLKTGDSYNYNEDVTYDSASLYKLWVMAVAYQKISEGSMKEDEMLKGELDKLNVTLEIATPSATPDPSSTPQPSPTPTEEERKAKEVSYQMGDAINRMITISDNYAALLVASRAGNFSIFPFLKKHNMTHSTFGLPPKTTAGDTAILLEKIYDGEIVNQNYSGKMIDLLKAQVINDRIPKYLPEGIQVAHKTGELGGNKHDAGIVFGNKGDYIIVVMSKTKDPYLAAEKIAKFSEEVFKHFED